MSNPLDPLIETLKAAEPRPGAADRAVAALRRPHPPRLVPFAAGVAALGLLALWPRGAGGLAWSQVAAQPLPDRYVIREESVVGGKTTLRSTIWQDRPARSRRTRFFPQKRLADFDFEEILSPRGAYLQLRPGYATFTRRPRPHVYRGMDVLDLETLVSDKRTKQLGVDRNVETRVGLADRYRLSSATYYLDKTKKEVETGHYEFLAYVEPGGKRILGYDHRDTKGALYQTTIEYPAQIDPAVFVTSKRPDVRLYDVDAIRAQAAKALAKPLGTATVKGQRMALRLVLQDFHKGIYTLWTGARPNGDLKDRVRILGHPGGGAYGLASLTSRGDRAYPVPYHAPYGGHCVGFDRRVSTLDLAVPVFAPGRPLSRFVGEATFRNVPVLQVDDVSSLAGLLGLFPKGGRR